MRKGAIADGRPRNGREPAIEYGKVSRQRSEHRQLVLAEVVHNLLRMSQVLLLLKIILDKSLHGGHARGALIADENLLVYSRKRMVGVRIELALKLGKRLHKDLVSLRVGVGLRAVHSINLRVHRLQRSQHVVERTVLHHEHDNVLQGIEAWGHRSAPFVGAAGTSASRLSRTV